jgi:hypothetical protein
MEAITARAAGPDGARDRTRCDGKPPRANAKPPAGTPTTAAQETPPGPARPRPLAYLEMVRLQWEAPLRALPFAAAYFATISRRWAWFP